MKKKLLLTLLVVILLVVGLNLIPKATSKKSAPETTASYQITQEPRLSDEKLTLDTALINGGIHSLIEADSLEKMGETPHGPIYFATMHQLTDSFKHVETLTEENSTVTSLDGGITQFEPYKWDLEYDAERDGYYYYFLESFSPLACELTPDNFQLVNHNTNETYTPEKAVCIKRTTTKDWQEWLIGFKVPFQSIKDYQLDFTIQLSLKDTQLQKKINSKETST